ncbi:hypothetical protein M378DRAFT_167436, partial [Amanita muscaria Koide BX008]
PSSWKSQRRVVGSFTVSPSNQPNPKANPMELLDTLKSIQTLGEKCVTRSTIKAEFLHVSDINGDQSTKAELGTDWIV